MHSRTALAAIAFAVLLVPAGIVAPAQASHGGDDHGGDHGGVRTSGHCGSTRWALKAKHDDGRIEVEGEIDSNRSGQKWHWAFKHNGSTSAKGTKRTTGSSGSFEVERRMTDLSGKDHFAFRATHGRTVCRGTISS
jgi:hypothetical protein